MKTIAELAETELSKFMSSNINVFSPNDQASKVLGVLRDTGRYEAVATDGSRTGVITVRDLMDVDQPSQTKVERIWHQTGSVSPKHTVLSVTSLLVENNVRAFPVFDGKELVGIISQDDVAEAMKDVSELKSLGVKNVISSPVVSLDLDDSVAQARKMMLSKGISHLPITKDEKLRGIVTAEIIVHTFITPSVRTTRGDYVGEKVSRFPGKVAGIMDDNPFTVGLDANALTVARGISERGDNACIIIDEERFIRGIVTSKEFVKLVAVLKREESPPVYILGITGEDFFEKAVAEDKVRRVVDRNMRIHPDLTEVSIRVKKQNKQGERSRYIITGRALSPNASYIAENEGWGLMETFDGFVDVLDKTLRKAKKEPQKGVRRGRKRPRPDNRP